MVPITRPESLCLLSSPPTSPRQAATGWTGKPVVQQLVLGAMPEPADL
jgi:hypothetical protein